jgi:DNA polymerase III alpha subunit
VVRDALELVERHGGPALEYARFNPLEDPATVELLARGDTVGVFYVESPAMRQLQKKTRRGDFEHLVIHSSIIRPAANDYINAYVDRLNGAPYTPLHPKLAELLRETFGIMVYQEDVSRAAMALAGFEPAAADELRKVLCKKRAGKRLEDYRQAFIRGCRERGVAEETIAALWNMIESFKGYSFCKPHSASYALLSFKSAYLRAHYPAELMAGVLSNGGGYYSTFAYISECRRMGLKVLAPDLNRSAVAYSGCRRAVRVGLQQIQGLEHSFLEQVVAELRRGGPFSCFEDFLRRVRPQPAQARRLVLAGACDRLDPSRTRPELLWQLKRWEKTEKVREKGPTLFSLSHRERAGVRGFAEDQPLPRPPQYRASELLRQELESLGFLLSRHPLSLYETELKRYRPIRAQNLPRHVGERVTLIGWWVTGKLVETSRQEPMEFITFEDTTALFETTFFPRAYARFCHLLQRARPYILRGKVEDDRGAISLNVDEVTLL